MKRLRKRQEENTADDEIRQLLFWRRVFVAVMVVLLIPLGIMSFYNHASSDDYVWALYPHQAIATSGGSPIAFLGGCLKMMQWNYMNQHGEFTAILLGVVNPLSWDDGWYWVSAFVLIGFLIFSVFCFWRLVAGKERKERLMADITAAIMSIILIELIPRAIDMYYWYDGSVNYLPFYAMLLILSGIFIRLYRDGRLSRRMLVLACVLAFLNVGGSYVTVAVNVVAVIGWGIIAMILFAMESKGAPVDQASDTSAKPVTRSVGSRRSFWICYSAIVASTVAGILLSVLAPGNNVRMGNEDEEQKIGSILELISKTIDYAAAFVKDQVDITMLLLLALFIPLFWRWAQIILRRAQESGRKTAFDLPAILVVPYAFFLHCTSYAPTIWIYSNEGAMRMEDVRFFYLVFWLVLLEFYFIGKAAMVLQNQNRPVDASDGGVQGTAAGRILTRFLAADLAMICIFGAAYYLIPETNRNKLSSVNATISLLKGEAQQYSREIEAQQAILEDPSTEGEDVEVPAVTSHPQLIYSSSLEMSEDPESWINQSVAAYYNKASVTLIRED